MRRRSKYIALLFSIALYTLGNNQIIAKAENLGDVESQITITFDKTYIPKDSSPTVTIPNGTVQIPTEKSEILPQTGGASNSNLQLIGFIILLVILLLIKRKKKMERN